MKTTGINEPTNSIERETLTYEIDPLETFHRFLKLHQCMLASFSANLEKQYDISVNEFRVLMMTGLMGVTASHEVVEATGIHIMAISRTVGALQRRGYISVEVDPTNRRRKLMKLTKEGKALYEKMAPTTSKVARYMLKSLRPDEIISFDYYLQTLNASVTAVDDDGKSIFIEQTRPDTE